jgi:hypothetical protein
MLAFPVSARALFKRRMGKACAAALVAAVMAMMLTVVPVGSSPPSATAMASEPGVALWAESTGDGPGIVWSASKSVAAGLVHSNSDLTISGSNNQLLGGTEYVGDLAVNPNGNVVDPPASMTGATKAPIEFDIADYRPGGPAAVTAGAQYHDGTAECGLEGVWSQHRMGTEIATGLHYVPCDVVISAAEISGQLTLVAEGTIQITGSRLQLGPAFADDLLLFTGSDAPDALRIEGGQSDFDGIVYAPSGQATVAGSGHHLRCPVIAETLTVKGSKHTFDGDPGCGVTVGNKAPVATDDEFEIDEDTPIISDAPVSWSTTSIPTAIR